MLAGIQVPVYAAKKQEVDVTVTVDKTSVKAGENVTFTFSYDRPVNDVVSSQFYVEYDKNVFTYNKAASAMPEEYAANFTLIDGIHTFAKTTPTNKYYPEKNFAGFEFMIPAFNFDLDFPAGVFYRMVLTAKEDIADTKESVVNMNSLLTSLDTVDKDDNDKLYRADVKVNGKRSYMDIPTHTPLGEPDNVTITVKPASSEEGYTASVAAAAPKYKKGETAYINVDVSDDFAASELILSYDGAALTFDESKSMLSGAKTNSETPGKLIVERYGEELKKSGGNPEYILAFTVNSDVTAASTDVKMEKASFSKSKSAGADDLTAATISADTATVNIDQNYSVTFTGSNKDDMIGESSVAPGATYTFRQKNIHYKYLQLKVTVGGTQVTPKHDWDTGVYTIENVTGDVTIFVHGRVPRDYRLTIWGSGANIDDEFSNNQYKLSNIPNGEYSHLEAKSFVFQYNKKCEINFKKKDGYTYYITMRIGGTDYTGAGGKPFTNYTLTDDKIIFEGADITGDVSVYVNRVPEGTGVVAVNVTGNGAEDLSLYAPSATIGQEYTFVLNELPQFDYDVAISVGGVQLAAGEFMRTLQNYNYYKYSIPGSKVTGDITINVTKTPKAPLKVEVEEYVKLDGKTMYLVTAKGTPGEGKTYNYGDSVMYHSDKYGAYCFLVIDDKPLTAEAAKEHISPVKAESVNVDYGMDVNMSGIVDANDSQLVYNMYNVKYADFGEIGMEKFLRADVNFDKKINVQDAEGIMGYIFANR